MQKAKKSQMQEGDSHDNFDVDGSGIGSEDVDESEIEGAERENEDGEEDEEEGSRFNWPVSPEEYAVLAIRLQADFALR